MCLIEQCNSKEKYGGYCFKHRKNYLCSDGIILYERFTNKESDYLKVDIVRTVSLPSLRPHFLNWKKAVGFSKKDLFIILSHLLESFKKYDDKDIKHIIRLQIRIRDKTNYELNKLRGPGFIDNKLCNNDTDFYSFDLINDINDKYFYSYKDLNGFIWFFDIRSLNKLIELKQPNPYTMNEIPDAIIEEADELTLKLKLNESDELINMKEIKQSRIQMIKQNTTDLFSDIDNSGHYCQPGWFLQLSAEALRKLYRSLEDLWNYRLHITTEVKSRICPPNGLIFTTRVNDIINYSKESLQELILNDVKKFGGALSSDDVKLGYMYFIIGLGSVSSACFQTHQWLMLV
jgi:hypothetical protein